MSQTSAVLAVDQDLNHACNLVKTVANGRSLPEGVGTETVVKAIGTLKFYGIERGGAWPDRIAICREAVTKAATEKALVRERERVTTLLEAWNVVSEAAEQKFTLLGFQTPGIVQAVRIARSNLAELVEETDLLAESILEATDLAWQAIDIACIAKAEQREEERQKSLAAAAATKIAAENKARETRHEKNLRRQNNRAQRAEENRERAGKAGCGTRQRQESAKRKR